MRILIATSSSSLSGGVFQALYQARALKRRGHETAFFIPETSVLWQEDPEDFLRPLPAEKKKWAFAMEGFFKNGQGGVVHAFHRMVNFCGWQGLLWKRRGIRCVSHRGVIYRPGNFLVYWGGGLSAVLPNSKACAQSFRFTCPKSIIRVIPNGLPPERLAPVRTREDILREINPAWVENPPFIWGYVGNDNPVKGVEMALDSFAAYLKGGGDGELILVGSHPGVWTDKVTALGLSGRTHFLGHKTHVANYYQIMDAFLFTSSGMDSMPNVVMEAMSSSLPVLGTSIGGVPEMLEPRALVAPGDANAMAAKMLEMFNNQDLRFGMAGANSQKSMEYTMDNRCNILEEVYERVLQA